MLTQLSLFLENRPGALSEACAVLKNAGVNLRALSLADTQQFGILRLLVDDPAAGKVLRVKKQQLLERAGSELIIFRNLQEVDAQEQSALFCLCAIARHHNISMDLRRVMHEFAIDSEEPRPALFDAIADHYELKTRRVRMSFEKICNLQQAFPAIARFCLPTRRR